MRRLIIVAAGWALFQRFGDGWRERCGMGRRQWLDLRRPVPFKADADRRHHGPKQKRKALNRRDHHARLRQRGNLVARDADAAVAARTAGPAQMRGLIGSVMRLLGLAAVPDRGTLCRRAETLEVPRAGTSGRPARLLAGRAGLKLCGESEWLHEKHGAKVRRPWRRLHFRHGCRHRADRRFHADHQRRQCRPGDVSATGTPAGTSLGGGRVPATWRQDARMMAVGVGAPRTRIAPSAEGCH